VRAPGAILLVACYELGHQPLAVAWPAAFLERHGYAPAVLDVSVEPFDAERAARARLVAISVPMHTALRLGVAVAARVRALNPACHIAFYGLYAVLNADALLGGVADSVLAGESEDALVGLVRELERAGAPAPGGQDVRQGVAGTRSLGVGSEPRAPGWSPVATGQRTRAAWSRDSLPHVLAPRRRATLEKLEFPVPSRAALPSLKKYAHLERDGRLELSGYVEASRGCRHTCRHCPIPPVYGGRFFVVPREVVLADVRQQVEAGATHVTFGDPDFLNGPGHALAVARALHAEHPSLTFDVTAKIEHLLRHRARLPELAALGCVFVVSAAESLSDAVLLRLAKGHTRADIVAALAAVRGGGIAFRPTWVPFTPWTTLADYRELLDFVEAHDLVDAIDPVQYSIRLLVPPGSLLLAEPGFAPFAAGLDAGAFHHRWIHPDPRVDELQAAVAARVAEAADRREDAAVTFGHVRALGDRAAGAAPRPAAAPPAGRRRPPRLTEPWFC